MGRPTMRNEVKMVKVINKSYDIILKALAQPDSVVTPAEKRRIALELCKKTAPKQVDIGGKAVDTFTGMMKQFLLKKKVPTSG